MRPVFPLINCRYSLRRSGFAVQSPSSLKMTITVNSSPQVALMLAPARGDVSRGTDISLTVHGVDDYVNAGIDRPGCSVSHAVNYSAKLLKTKAGAAEGADFGAEVA